MFVPVEQSAGPSFRGSEENGDVDNEVVDVEVQRRAEKVDTGKAATREVMDAMNLWERDQRASETAEKEKEKQRRKRPSSDNGEGPVKKRKRTSSSEEEAQMSTTTKGKGKAVVLESNKTLAEPSVEEKPRRKRKLDPEAEKSKFKSTQADAALPSKAKKPKQDSENAKPKTKGHSRHKSTSDSTAVASTSTVAPVPSTPSSSGPDSGLDSEICGMLIESMASSRASSLATSSLYKSVMQNHPRLKVQKSEKDWIAVFERVLRAGERKGTGVFGKVESNGQVRQHPYTTHSSFSADQLNSQEEPDHQLEAQWFYIPERDEDQERAMLIRSMMPRPAKRSETKKYKQYYYRPLDKISRWDPEDEI